jgi:hypothetical protein
LTNYCLGSFEHTLRFRTNSYLNTDLYSLGKVLIECINGYELYSIEDDYLHSIKNTDWTKEKYPSLFQFLNLLFDKEANVETKLKNPGPYIKSTEELDVGNILRENIDSISTNCYQLRTV